jgi:hypothetical protein
MVGHEYNVHQCNGSRRTHNDDQHALTGNQPAPIQSTWVRPTVSKGRGLGDYAFTVTAPEPLDAELPLPFPLEPTSEGQAAIA